MSQPTLETAEAESIEEGDSVLPPEGDLAGQERLAWNVFAGWSGYLIVSAIGVLAPPVMDRKLGQEALGAWDFGWSLVTYLGLTQLGIAGSVNRYVAKYRARGDVAGLRRVASSVTALNLGAAVLSLLLAAAFAWSLPRLLRVELASQLSSLRWLVVLLGMSVAAQMAFQVYQGVLAGCYRFDILNVITGTFEAANSVAIIAVLLAGGGLVALGVVCFLFELAKGVARMIWAARICPELRMSAADVKWNEARRLLRFGVKALVFSLSGLLLLQANKLIVGGALGVAALAVFSRPLALIRVGQTFAAKFAYVLTPTASSLQSNRQHSQLASLLLESSRLGTALALPIVLTLVIFGDLIMLLWMGPRYTGNAVSPLLALGYFGVLALTPVTTILMGMNRHGWPALATLAAAGVSALLGLLNALVLHWGLNGAALAVALPLVASSAYLVAFACRDFELSVGTFARKVFGAPLACGIPFALILVASRFLLPERAFLAVFVGLALAGPTLLVLYWRFVIPEAWRAQIRELPGQVRVFVSR